MSVFSLHTSANDPSHQSWCQDQIIWLKTKVVEALGGPNLNKLRLEVTGDGINVYQTITIQKYSELNKYQYYDTSDGELKRFNPKENMREILSTLLGRVDLGGTSWARNISSR